MKYLLKFFTNLILIYTTINKAHIPSEITDIRVFIKEDKRISKEDYANICEQMTGSDATKSKDGYTFCPSFLTQKDNLSLAECFTSDLNKFIFLFYDLNAPDDNNLKAYFNSKVKVEKYLTCQGHISLKEISIVISDYKDDIGVDGEEISNFDENTVDGDAEHEEDEDEFIGIPVDEFINPYNKISGNPDIGSEKKQLVSKDVGKKEEVEIDKIYEEGKQLLKCKSYYSALEEFEEIILHNPHDRKLFYTKGYALEKLNKYSKAIESYKFALLIKEKLGEVENLNFKINYRLGVTHIKLQQFKHALRYFEVALKFDEQNLKAKKYINFIQEIQTNKCLKTNDSEEIKFKCSKAAEVFNKFGSYDGAILSYNKLINNIHSERTKIQSTKDPNKKYVMGLERNNIEGKLFALNQSEYSYLNKLGEIFLKVEKYDKALNYYEEAFSINKDIDFLLKQGEILITLESFDKAEKIYNTALNMLELRRRMNKVTKMPERLYYDKLATIYSKFGEILLKLEDYEKAESLYEAYIHNEPKLPKNPDFYEGYGDALSKLGDEDIAHVSYTVAKNVSKKPSSRLLLKLGQHYETVEDYVKALAHYNEAVIANPSDINGYIALGDVYIKKNEKASAENYYSFAAKLVSKDYNDYIYLGDRLCEYKRFEEALRSYKKAFVMGGDKFGPLLVRLGDLYMILGSKSEALSMYEKVFREDISTDGVDLNDVAKKFNALQPKTRGIRK
jgi:tetratricopeptide (TPR) repeat protein